MTEAYTVCKYSIQKLKEILIEKFPASNDLINTKYHSSYFESYFQELKAQTIIVEHDYTDHDFLEDYANYYVKCFKLYDRKCVRLHIFSKPFSRSQFESYLNGAESEIDEKILNESYLGFIVIKPLPQTLIGRTCLKTYDKDNGRRFFPPVRDYEANLFGIKLEVRTLAYQEQDTVVAACATSALWSVLNGTGRLFQHQIFSPVEISQSACSDLPLESRYFPNPGLTPAQMAQAIRSIGLEPYLIRADNQEILRAASYAYLQCKIPMILGVQMIDVSGPDPVFKGMHAVALTGFSLGNAAPVAFGPTGLLTKASMVDKVYAHDDQIGPFARMILEHVDMNVGSVAKPVMIKAIHTSWPGDNGKPGGCVALPTILLVPLYHKIRLPFESIQETIIQFDETIESFRNKGKTPLQERLVWDIYLTTVNEVKSGMLSSRKWRDSLRSHSLLESMPRFIWRATAFHQGKYLIDLLFDATDIEQSSYLFHAVGYDEIFFNTLKAVSQDPNRPPVLNGYVLRRILDWFSR